MFYRAKERSRNQGSRIKVGRDMIDMFAITSTNEEVCIHVGTFLKRNFHLNNEDKKTVYKAVTMTS